MIWLVVAALASFAGYLDYAVHAAAFTGWAHLGPLAGGLLFAYVLALRGAYGTWAFPFLGFRAERGFDSRQEARLLALIWIGAAAFRGVLVAAPPVLSDDLYRYIWDGRVLLSGTNPYRYPPTAPELAPLRDVLWPLINHPGLPTIYPPVSMLFFAASAWISPTVLAWKVLISILDLLAGYGFMRAIAAGGGQRTWVALYLWHPLVLLEFAGNGHVDAVGMLFFAVALWAFAVRRPLGTGAALAMAGLVKFLPWVALPALWPRLRGRWLLVPLLIGFFYLPFWWNGVNPLGSLGVFLAKWRGNDFLFSVFVPTNAGEAELHRARLIAGGVVVLVWLLTMAFRRSWLSVYAWTAGTMLLVSPVTHPWYVIWLLPVLFVLPHPAWWVWSLTVLIGYAPLAVYRATGVWEESLAWKAWEVSPALTLLPLQMWLERRRTR